MRTDYLNPYLAGFLLGLLLLVTIFLSGRGLPRLDGDLQAMGWKEEGHVPSR